MGFAEFYLPRFLLAIPPVFAFLWALRVLDTFRLVKPRRVIHAIGYGCGAALLCFLLDSAIFRMSPENADLHAKTAGPVIEEICTALYVFWLVRTARVGFMVDAAICGFAVGAGFALIENLYYMEVLGSSSLAVWTLRGFGTAIMHGGTTAIVGIVIARVPARSGNYQAIRFTAGLALAIGIHIGWNIGLMTPLESSVAVLVGLPVLFGAIFVRSEQALHRWMGDRLDHDLEMLHIIRTGEYTESRTSEYLRTLEQAFPPDEWRDMVRILEISAALSGAAKGNLLRVAAGMPPARDPEAEALLREMRVLRKRVGKSAMRAMTPLLTHSSHDLWELNQLRS